MTEISPSKTRRLTMVDGLRGYALMGLFLVHMTGYFELYNARPDPSWVQETTRFLFQGKSFSLMGLCFGFSFFMILDGARRRGQPFALNFVWRMVVLLGIGWLHAMIYRGEIIVVLAITGLLLIPFNLIKSTRILGGIAVFMLLQPLLLIRIVAGWMGHEWAWAEPLFYHDGGAMRPSLWGDFGELVSANIEAGRIAKWSYFIETGRIFQVLGLFLIGLVAGRTGFFADPRRFRRLRIVALVIALLAIVPLDMWRDQVCCARLGPNYFGFAMISGWIDLAGTTICVMAFIQLWLWGQGRILERLVPVGRMTLTLYVGQSLVFVPVFYGFGLHLWDRITQVQSLALGIAAFAVQLAFATLWFRRFAYGPLEWIWRAGTKLSMDVPFRLRPDALKRA